MWRHFEQPSGNGSDKARQGPVVEGTLANTKSMSKKPSAKTKTATAKKAMKAHSISKKPAAEKAPSPTTSMKVHSNNINENKILQDVAIQTQTSRYSEMLFSCSSLMFFADAFLRFVCFSDVLFLSCLSRVFFGCYARMVLSDVFLRCIYWMSVQILLEIFAQLSDVILRWFCQFLGGFLLEIRSF